jgi:hypothetical protein
MLEKKDIIHENFDHNLYMRIRKSRRLRNEIAGEIIYPTFENLYPDGGRQYGHEWEGAKLYDHKKKRTVTIDTVHHHWYHGWFVMVLFYTEYKHLGEIKRSHGQLSLKNISCKNETILKGIAKDSANYSFVKEGVTS